MWGYVARSRKSLLGKKVTIQRPEEPKDIVWENLGGKEDDLKIRFKTGFATFGLLAIWFCVVMASAEWKKYLLEESNDEASDQ